MTLEDFFSSKNPSSRVSMLNLSTHDCWVDMVKLQSVFNKNSFDGLFTYYATGEEWNRQLIEMGYKNVSDLFLDHGLFKVDAPDIGCVSWFQQGQVSDFFNVYKTTYAAFYNGEYWIKRGSAKYVQVSEREKNLIENVNGIFSFVEVIS